MNEKEILKMFDTFTDEFKGVKKWNKRLLWGVLSVMACFVGFTINNINNISENRQDIAIYKEQVNYIYTENVKTNTILVLRYDIIMNTLQKIEAEKTGDKQLVYNKTRKIEELEEEIKHATMSLNVMRGKKTN